MYIPRIYYHSLYYDLVLFSKDKFEIYCNDLGVCGYGRGTDWRMALLITYTQNKELEAITVLSLNFEFYKSTEHSLSLFPACRVLASRSLTTASNMGDSSALRALVLTSQIPVQN